jgi:hypothetical protein
MRINKIILTLFIAGATAQTTAAQWLGADMPPKEPSHKNTVFLGEDTSTTTTAGGPSAHVEVYGEGWDTPPVYITTQEQISALKLNKKQEALLKAEFPDFVPWTLSDYGISTKHYPFSKLQFPYAVSWDYDGKGTPATVITGHDTNANYVVILRPEKDGYKISKMESGFITDYNHTTKILTALRLIKRTSVVHVEQSCGPSFSEEIWHAGFADMDVAVSTNHSPIEHFDTGIANRIVYYREGLFPVDRSSISAFKPSAPVAFNAKLNKDIMPTADILKAVMEYDKDFKIWNTSDYPKESVPAYRYSEYSMPYALKYDLNGDGTDDMVIAGHNNDSNMVLELLSGAGGYHVRGIAGSESCYRLAREHNEQLKPRPSHILSFYKKGTDFGDFKPKVLSRFWHYNSEILVGMQPLNTCMKQLNPPQEDVIGQCEIFEKYDGWQLRPGTAKEALFIYGERDYSIGDDCNGGDGCNLSLMPPGAALR